MESPAKSYQYSLPDTSLLRYPSTFNFTAAFPPVTSPFEKTAVTHTAGRRPLPGQATRREAESPRAVAGSDDRFERPAPSRPPRPMWGRRTGRLEGRGKVGVGTGGASPSQSESIAFDALAWYPLEAVCVCIVVRMQLQQRYPI